MYFVYILKCSDNSLYTGIAVDTKKRIKVHESGKGSKYVRARLPVKLVYFEEAESRAVASKREAQIKGMNKNEKLALISSPHNETSEV